MNKMTLKNLNYYGLSLLLTFLIAPQISSAATLNFSFDEFISGTDLTNQYQSLGITANGVSVYGASATPWPATSGANIAVALTGLMNFTFDTSITGNIKTVSAVVSGDLNTGIFAYDSLGNLVGQSLLSSAGSSSALLTVTSLTSPIASIAIHDGGASFAIDNLSLVQEVSAPVCSDVVQSLSANVDLIPDSEFRHSRERKSNVDKRAEIKKEIAKLQKLILAHASKAKLLDQLKEAKEEIDENLKKGSYRNDLLNQIKQIKLMINAGQC